MMNNDDDLQTKTHPAWTILSCWRLPQIRATWHSSECLKTSWWCLLRSLTTYGQNHMWLKWYYDRWKGKVKTPYMIQLVTIINTAVFGFRNTPVTDFFYPVDPAVTCNILSSVAKTKVRVPRKTITTDRGVCDCQPVFLYAHNFT